MFYMAYTKRKKSGRNFIEFFYIIPLENLESILKYGILSRREIEVKGLKFTNIANPVLLIPMC